jgi:hypothetical protein
MMFGSGRAILAVAALIVVAAVIAGIVVLGSPATERLRRLDGARVADLQTLDRLVTGFARTHGSVPADIETLIREPGYSVPRSDPESRVPYEYRRLSAGSFQLCATFNTDSANQATQRDYAMSFNAAWAHGRGRQCFDRHTEIPKR